MIFMLPYNLPNYFKNEEKPVQAIQSSGHSAAVAVVGQVAGRQQRLDVSHFHTSSHHHMDHSATLVFRPLPWQQWRYHIFWRIRCTGV